MLHQQNLRDFLDKLDERGDLRRIQNPVSTHLDIGAISRIACENFSQAVLFENIIENPQFRALGAFESYSSDSDNRMAKVAIALGLDPHTHPLDIVKKLADSRSVTPIEPIIVATAPCQENILLGKEAKLSNLPVPLLHYNDGGKYVNTIGAFIIQTQDKTWTNWSVARAMLIDDYHFIGMTASIQHIGNVRATWGDENGKIPVALVLGADPATIFVSGIPLTRYGHNEVDYLGGYFGEPMKLVNCKTIPLQVPAEAEIIIEANILPGVSAPEGPMAEYHGYVHGGPVTDPAHFSVYEVTAITYRNNAIFPVVAAGKPVDEDHTICGPGMAAAILDHLRQGGFPVEAVWSVPESANHIYAIALADSWEKELPDHSLTSVNAYLMKIAQFIKGGPEKTIHESYWIQRILFTNNDIDISNPNDLWWAFATRCRPGDNQQILDGAPIMPLSPIVNLPEESLIAKGRIEVLNCLLPLSQEKDAPKPGTFKEDIPEELQQRILDIFHEGIVNKPKNKK